MAITKYKKVEDLNLDLANFRTVHQPDEEHAINALIAIHPSYFWGLMESLLDDGYSPTENIIVIKVSGRLTVKEGNRRIASLKLIHGLIGNIELPENIQKRIDALPTTWKAENESVPCAIYEAKDASFVDKLIARTHAKGDTSGRDKWPAVARARFARDQNKRIESGLDLLEAYLKAGKNLNPQQAERWSGDYPLTVLDEAIQKLAPLLGCKSAGDLASQYPKKHRKTLDAILLDMGVSNLGFKELRAANWTLEYGIQPAPVPGGQVAGAQSGLISGGPGSIPVSGGSSNNATGGSGPNPVKGSSAISLASNDPKSVRKKLRDFKVRGKGRDKIVTLFNEIKTLKLEDHPHAFCFLLRSIFELSAKAYCADHKKAGGPDAKRKDGKDKELADLLRDIANHIIGNPKDMAKVRILHGPTAELAKKEGMLSVTSMNQLVHNPAFSIVLTDISILFGNVFPLLEEMNG